MLKLRWLLAALFATAVLPPAASAQERGTISGIVTDASSGQPLSNAQVLVAGTRTGALTNQEGRFVLPGVAYGTHTLEVSFVGYRQVRQEVTVGAQTALVAIQMQVDALRLDELVVVGYGVEKRRNVTGAISSMKAETVQELPTPSIDNVLQGRLAGVQVTQNSGNPGAAISVRIRGSSSISAGNQPLYVVDGVPMTQGNFSGVNSTFGGQGIDALADLNPNEIESIEVLKDASAAAIYGSRASNGVVLITTKRGVAKERPDIQFNAYYGTQRDWKRVEFLNTDEYIAVRNEARKAAGKDGALDGYYGYRGPGVDTTRYSVLINPGTSTDWIDQVLRSAPVSSMTGSIAGGTERARYYVSGSAFNQDGIVQGFGYERLNGRLNLDYSAGDKLTLGTNVALTRSITQRSRGDNTIYGPFANAIANAPYQTVFNEDGSYTRTIYANPVGLARENEAQERGIRILANAFANYALVSGVNARVAVGLDQLNHQSRIYDSPVVGVATGSNGSGTVANASVTKLTYEGTVNWLRDFGEKHSVSGVVGVSYEDNSTERNSLSGQQFPTQYFRYLTSAAEITGGSSSLTGWSLLSYFTRMSYTLANRYTATFNLRTDGSSRFGADNRFGVFPSASLLWRVGEEAFMQDQDVVRNLALRVSYGRTGNQFGIGDFASRGLVQGGTNYAGQPGLSPSQLGNPGLRWETTDQFNVGSDFAILGERLSLGLDYYIKKTHDLLIERPIPSTTGFTTIWTNIGAMENRGVELVARARLVQGGRDGFNWNADFNISRNRNVVTALYNNEPITSGASRVEVGQPLGVFYGYVTDGIFRTAEEVKAHATQSSRTAAGDIRFKDLKGDGVINDSDRTIIGSPWPDFEGGVTNTLSYRGIDVNVFLQYSYGNDVYNSTRRYTEAYGSGADNNTKRALGRWTPENPDATEPRAIDGDPNNNTRNSDRFVEDGSYLRVKNAVVGYTFPTELAQRLGMRKLRVYVQGQNLLTFTNYSGWDPEVNTAGDSSITRGTDFYTLPQPRTLTAGFNVSF